MKFSECIVDMLIQCCAKFVLILILLARKTPTSFSSLRARRTQHCHCCSANGAKLVTTKPNLSLSYYCRESKIVWYASRRKVKVESQQLYFRIKFDVIELEYSKGQTLRSQWLVGKRCTRDHCDHSGQQGVS